MQDIKSIIVMAGDSQGHFIECVSGHWHLADKQGVKPKTYANVIAALSELERAAKIPSTLFTVAYPDFAIIPIQRRVG